MTRHVPASDFVPCRAGVAVAQARGLPDSIDLVAASAPASHRFLRRAWFDAATADSRSDVHTLVAARDGVPGIALPVSVRRLGGVRMGSVPGCYWPFRSFPTREDADPGMMEAALMRLADLVHVLRIGPVYDGDPAMLLVHLVAAALGWTILGRFIADSYLLDMAARRAEGPFPRTSTLKKNRFHEKHLAAHGALDWRFVTGAAWTAAAFGELAEVERRSWIATRTDGRDAKFTAEGHGAFWRRAAADPELARMFWAAVLRVDGRPAAFSFDLNAGAVKYAIANSYDPAFAKHSPGKLLYYRNLVRAGEDGIRLVDWGAGDSGYKGVIGAEKGPAIRDWLLIRPGLPRPAAQVLAAAWRRSGHREAIAVTVADR